MEGYGVNYFKGLSSAVKFLLIYWISCYYKVVNGLYPTTLLSKGKKLSSSPKSFLQLQWFSHKESQLSWKMVSNFAEWKGTRQYYEFMNDI